MNGPFIGETYQRKQIKTHVKQNFTNRSIIESVPVMSKFQIINTL